MNIALVDDLAAELDRMEGILDEYATSNGLQIDIQRFASAEELLDVYRPYQYTVVFLDIYMDGATGVEAAQRIRQVDADTIIVFLISMAIAIGVFQIWLQVQFPLGLFEMFRY